MLTFPTDGDAYDEMLTREEIQTMITKMNLLMALERVEECVKNFDLQVEFLFYKLAGFL